MIKLSDKGLGNHLTFCNIRVEEYRHKLHCSLDTKYGFVKGIHEI